LCLIHVTVKSSLGFTLQDCNRVMEHTRFLLLKRSTSVEGCCSRIEREARKIAECTSYTPCVLLSFFLNDSCPSKQMCVDCFHIVCLFLSNPCTPSILSKEAFVYFVCPIQIPQPPFAWRYYSFAKPRIFKKKKHATPPGPFSPAQPNSIYSPLYFPFVKSHVTVKVKSPQQV